MTPFYSIIKIVPNPVSIDVIAVGLIIFDGVDFHLDFSNHKIGIAKRLMIEEKENLTFIKKTITKKIEEVNKSVQSHLLSNIEYFSYLERYNTNTLQFGYPQKYVSKNGFSQSDFEKLFNAIIDKKYQY